MSEAIFQARQDLAVALRWADRHGLAEGVCNHFSLMAPGLPDHFLINPIGLHWSEMTPDDIVLCDNDGNVVDGDHEIETSAFLIHRATHMAHPRALCVLHTHMPYSTTLSLLDPGRLEWCSQNSMRFHGRVAYDDHYNGLAVADAEGRRIAAALGDGDVLFLRHHGVVVCGPTVAVAYDDLYYLERTCQLQVLARSTGQPLLMIDDAIAEETAEQFRHQAKTRQAGLHFEALRRILARDEPAFETVSA